MNDIRRSILWVVFGFSMVLLWDQWQVYNGRPATFFPSPSATAKAAGASAPAGSAPASAAATNGGVPTATAPAANGTPAGSAAVPTEGQASAAAPLPEPAAWVERHFTLDRTWKGTDHSASLEPDGLRKLVRDLRAVATALTHKPVAILDVEAPQRAKLKRVPGVHLR